MKHKFSLSWPGEHLTGPCPQPDESSHASSTHVMVNFSIILPPTPRSPGSFFSTHETFAVSFVLLDLVTFLILIEQYKSLCISVQPLVSCSLLGPSVPCSLTKPEINKQLWRSSLLQVVALLYATNTISQFLWHPLFLYSRHTQYTDFPIL